MNLVVKFAVNILTTVNDVISRGRPQTSTAQWAGRRSVLPGETHHEQPDPGSPCHQVRT